MEPGRIVEYIDRQRIICAVVMEVKQGRLRLVNENSREVNLNAGRLLHADRKALVSGGGGRERMIEALKRAAERREALSRQVNVREIWEVLGGEQEWIDLPTMTAVCFPRAAGDDEASAVLRAFFEDRLYFRFDRDRFFPQSSLQVERSIAQQQEAERRQQVVELGGQWLRRLIGGAPVAPDPGGGEIAALLRDYYLFEKESAQAELARAVMEKAGMADPAALFDPLVRLGIFSAHENVDLQRLAIPNGFSPEVAACCGALLHAPLKWSDAGRCDLTDLPLMTIDGQATLDFDDALSLEDRGSHLRLGIHIVDVGAFIPKGNPIDAAAGERGSSIYMPDRRIPMLPPELAEGLCSLRAGELRPAISVQIDLSPAAEILNFEVLASLIRVRDQRTYYDVNLVAEQDPIIVTLRELAGRLRQKRLDAGAVHISLPEINIWIDDSGAISVNRVNRESPSRMLVSELMILANGLMARFLIQKGLPAVFRAQPEPRERLFRGEEGSLLQNFMQRKHLARFVLGPQPERHCGLGLEAYVTATSPIRKYFDLITQRQIRAALGLEAPYSAEEIASIIRATELPMSNVGRLQQRRNRYWLLKHLEGRTGSREEAIVLGRWRRATHVLLPAYMLECELQGTGVSDLKPEEVVQVTVQHVNARREMLTIFMA